MVQSINNESDNWFHKKRKTIIIFYREKIKTSYLFKFFIWFLVSILLPVLVIIFLSIWCYEAPTGDIKPEYGFFYIDHIITTYKGILPILFSLFILSFSIIKDSRSQFLNKFDKVKKDLDNKIDKHLQKTKIVFESGIYDYDENFLSSIQLILNDLEKNHESVTELFFIDHSSAIKWWSESMTGYISLLAKWQSRGENRRINRFFIFSKNELLSPITVKTLAFHSMLGFNTYIFREDYFEDVIDSLNFSSFRQKELFLWNNSINNQVNFRSIDGTDWSNIIMYQSFWDIDKHSKSDRDTLMKSPETVWRDYLENEKRINEIDIWFEFLPVNDKTKIIVENNNNLITSLINNSYCCSYRNHISSLHKINKPNFFGIKIKTEECTTCGSREIEDEKNRCFSPKENDGIKFGYVNSKNIGEILIEYSNI